MDNLAKMSRVQKMTFSAMVMAMYIVILYFTQSFSFGAYQIRIATALYALAYLFPALWTWRAAASWESLPLPVLY